MEPLLSWLSRWGNAGAVANIKADLDHDQARRESVNVLAQRVEVALTVTPTVQVPLAGVAA
jgi:hypothetical protein